MPAAAERQYHIEPITNLLDGCTRWSWNTMCGGVSRITLPAQLNPRLHIRALDDQLLLRLDHHRETSHCLRSSLDGRKLHNCR